MRTIGKVAKFLARKQLAGKDIRSKIDSECYYSGFNRSHLMRLIKEEIQIMEGKQYASTK